MAVAGRAARREPVGAAAGRGTGRYVSAVAGSSGRRREECGRPSDAERPSPPRGHASRILRPRIPMDVAASTFRHLATTFDTRTLLCMPVMNGILRDISTQPRMWLCFYFCILSLRLFLSLLRCLTIIAFIHKQNNLAKLIII